MSNVENAEEMATPKTAAAVSDGSENVLPPAIAKELADIREMVQDVKKMLSDFVDAKDAAINLRADDLENATCEQSETTEARLTDIEVALCDLSEQIAGV